MFLPPEVESDVYAQRVYRLEGGLYGRRDLGTVVAVEIALLPVLRLIRRLSRYGEGLPVLIFQASSEREAVDVESF